MKSMIQIGAGNIGRACIGRLFHDAGYKIYFSDINQNLLDKLHHHKQYPIRLVGKDCDKEIIINNVDILPLKFEDQQQIIKEISLITTAVGVPILPKIAPLIAKIIKYRFMNNINSFLNIIACENAIRASSELKHHVNMLLSPEIQTWAQKYIAFPDAATDSIVPTIISNNPLQVTSENFAELIIEKSTFLGDLPEVEGLYLKDNLDAYIERKLFTLNTGHAITAYIGYQQNLQTIQQAISSLEIRSIVEAAMHESGSVLIKRYGFNENQHNQYITKILSRFENPYLDDEVVRVGRDPMRKLSKNDRLIKPALGAIEYNLPFNNLLIGIKNALLFQNENDISSIEMQEILKQNGLKQGIIEITGLKNTSNEQLLINKILEIM